MKDKIGSMLGIACNFNYQTMDCIRWKLVNQQINNFKNSLLPNSLALFLSFPFGCGSVQVSSSSSSSSSFSSCEELISNHAMVVFMNFHIVPSNDVFLISRKINVLQVGRFIMYVWQGESLLSITNTNEKLF
jgi:hypothetical protein